MAKLRIGLLLDAFDVSAWEYAVIRQLLESDYATVALVVLNEQRPRSLGRQFQRLWTNKHKIVHYVYSKLDRKLFKSKCVPDAFEERDASKLLQDVPVLQVKPRQTTFSDYIERADIEQIRSHDLDILVRVGFRILRGEILSAARYGVWSYHHGDNLVNRGGPAGHWEVFENWDATGTVLQILQEDLDNGLVLFRTWAATQPLSPSVSRNAYFWHASAILNRKIRELHDVGPGAFFAQVDRDNRDLVLYSQRLFTEPGNLAAIKYIGRQLCKVCREFWRRTFYISDFWILMYQLNKADIGGSLWRYKKIIPPKDRFYADPHVVYRDGQYYIFIEEFLFGPRKGHISLIVMQPDGTYAAPVTVLERDYHLSYPFVFQVDGEDYMIPETAANGTIELYKAERFPDQWTRVGNLFENITAFDTTLYFKEGRWWLFTNIVEAAGASGWDELFLYYADDLLGPWTAHPNNPIVSDARNARPAGRIFERAGKIYRPAQNSSHGQYGFGFNINEIVTLSTTQYEERTVSRVEPNWDRRISATHSFSHDEKLTMIDAIYRRRRFL